MKTTLWIGFCVLTALALPAGADAWDTPLYRVDGGVHAYLKITTGNATLPLAPWFLYWPAEAYRQPIGPPIAYYPNWQQPRPVSAAFAYPPPSFPTTAAPPSGFQRASYQYPGGASQQAPGYWYGQ